MYFWQMTRNKVSDILHLIINTPQLTLQNLAYFVDIIEHDVLLCVIFLMAFTKPLLQYYHLSIHYKLYTCSQLCTITENRYALRAFCFNLSAIRIAHMFI